MAHLDCMGSIIFSEVLQARANLVVLLYNSIVLLSACWAAWMFVKNIEVLTHLFKLGRPTLNLVKTLSFKT